MEIKSGYKKTEVGVIPEDWEVRTLGVMATQVASGRSKVGASFGHYPVHGSTGVIGFTNHPDYEGDVILAARVGANAGKLNLVTGRYGVTDNTIMLRLKTVCSLQFFWRQLESKRINTMVFGSGQPLITGTQLKALALAFPPLPEQRAIAGALSEVDALLGAQEALLAKKRDLKAAAMQQLLTGQKRLPSFTGEWEVKTFGEVLTRINAKPHQIQTSDYQPSGRYPVVDQGKNAVIGFSDREEKQLRCPKGGVIVFGDHTCIVKFIDFNFLVGADGTQILQAKAGQNTRFHALQLQYRGIETTGYNRHFKFLKEREFVSPPLAEQTAIAAVLSDMDAEIAALEAQRDKTRTLKQGMMQELLTGRIRLV